MKNYLILALGICLTVSCQSHQKSSQAAPQASPWYVNAVKGAIDNSDKIGAFLVRTSHLKDTTESVKAILYLAQQTSGSSARFSDVRNTVEQVLYDAGSPYRNERLYRAYLGYILPLNNIEEVLKEKYREQLTLINKNRIGATAHDISLTSAHGHEFKLSSITAQYLLLMISNPECHACEEIQHQIIGNRRLAKLINLKLLKVVTVYPDEEVSNWRKHVKDYPPEFINGYDKHQEIRNQQTYDLRAIPTLYLLDSKKKVLLRDTSVEQLARFPYALPFYAQ